MDITSFILGISSVIVVALVTGVVVGLVKVRQIIKYQEDLSTKIEDTGVHIYNELMATANTENIRWSDHNRTLYSRLDKLINRLEVLEEKAGVTKQKKQLLND